MDIIKWIRFGAWILGILFLSVLIIGFSSTYFSFQNERSILLDSLHERGATLRRSLGQSLILPLMLEDEAELGRLLATFMEEPDLEYLMLRDAQGRIYERHAGQTPPLNPGDLEAVTTLPRREVVLASGTRCLELRTPIVPRGFSLGPDSAKGESGRLGVLVLGLSLARIDAQTRGGLIHLLLINIGALVIVLPIGTLLIHRLTMRMRPLVEADRERTQSLGTIVETTADAIISMDPEGLVLSWNKAAEDLFSYAPQELVGSSVATLWAANQGEVGEMLAGLRSKPGVLRLLRQLRRRDGAVLDVALTISPLLDTAQQTQRFSAIIRDITEEKRAAERQRTIIESAPNAMLMVNQEGRILLINRQAESLFGYVREELVGEFVEKLIPQRYHPKHPDFRGSFFANPKTLSLGAGRDLFGLRKDGSEVPVEIGVNPIETPEGICALASIIDITERRNAQDKIQRYAGDLKRSNEELERFAYIASHDMQEPLRKVVAFGNLLTEELGDGLKGSAREYLDRMKKAALRMSDLIQALLAYSRATRAGGDFELVSLRDILQEVMENLETEIGEKKAYVEVSGDLPVVKAVKSQMSQLFQNLLSNAVKYSRKDVQPHIAVHGRRAEGKLEITVKDNGIGFEPQYAEKIFEPFMRLNTRADYAGTGIGLSICLKIVQNHQGAIIARGEPGKGSCFTMTFPQSMIEEL